MFLVIDPIDQSVFQGQSSSYEYLLSIASSLLAREN